VATAIGAQGIPRASISVADAAADIADTIMILIADAAMARSVARVGVNFTPKVFAWPRSEIGPRWIFQNPQFGELNA
jgi:hypothetical protein